MKSFEKIVNATRALVDLGDECERQERRANTAETEAAELRSQLRKATGRYNVVMVRHDGFFMPFYIEGADRAPGEYNYRPPWMFQMPYRGPVKHPFEPVTARACDKSCEVLTFERTDRKDALGRVIYEER